MANVRWKDKDALATVHGAERMPITNISSIDKYITPTQIRTYMLNGVTLTELAILNGAHISTAELNILRGVTSTHQELNILHGVTATKDELNITDESGTAAIYSSGNIVKIKSTVTDYSFDSTGFYSTDNIDLGDADFLFKDLYLNGIANIRTLIVSETSSFGGLVALDQASQKINTSIAIDATSSKTTINTGSGGLALTIADGRHDGQLKYLYMIVSSGGTATLASPNFIGTSLVFSNRGEGAVLIWDAPAENWFCVNVNGAAWTA